MSLRAVNPNASTQDELATVIKTNVFVDTTVPSKFDPAWARYNIAKDLFFEKFMMFGFFAFIAGMIVLFIYCGL